ncbi:acetyl esterase [Crossiella equi]|uniref:Acetyl esterase n=1 Tax=Crossiella equi TaxID=130796 RepID=A0ABS5ALQ5_9PSEU|nr:alpha/beta hydrolase fold domain-containing protein [Crossiella equi]MBP2477366.1 acetyl esterase [Crossiella equi]
MRYEVDVDGGVIGVVVHRPVWIGALPCYLHLPSRHGRGEDLSGLATDAGCAIVSVEHRLDAGHSFATALEDCYTALMWLLDNAALLELDASRLAVGGSREGADLTAALPLLIKERGGPAIGLQVLELPTLLPDPATEPTGVPPALIAVGEHEPGRIEAEKYARRLTRAGVPTTLHRVGPGAFEAVPWRIELARTLRAGLVSAGLPA